MKIGIAQINPTVGDLNGNLEIMVDAYRPQSNEWLFSLNFPFADTPETCPLKVFGSDCSEVLNKFIHTKDARLCRLSRTEQPNPGKADFIYTMFQTRGSTGFRKRLLPTYDVFDEHRYFAEGNASMSLAHAGIKIGVSICEDIWNVSGDLHPTDPVKNLAGENISLLINMSASPWHQGKHDQRLAIINQVSHDLNCPVVYVNAVGGNDELVFDGGSVLLDSKSMGMHSLLFKSDCQVIDSSQLPPHQGKDDQLECTRKALVLGLRDYAHKVIHRINRVMRIDSHLPRFCGGH